MLIDMAMDAKLNAMDLARGLDPRTVTDITTDLDFTIFTLFMTKRTMLARLWDAWRDLMSADRVYTIMETWKLVIDDTPTSLSINQFPFRM